MAIIAINGKIGSGKDLTGRIIQILTCFPKISNEKLIKDLNKPYDNYNFQIKKFADKLKDIVCLLFNCTREQLEDREFKEKELGEEWRVYKIDYQTEYDGISHEHSKIFLTENEAVDWYEPLYLRPLRGRYVQLTPRLMLQLLGTECGRNIIHPNIWVNSLFSEYKIKGGFGYTNDAFTQTSIIKNGSYPNWIITDMRFPNELKAIEDRGGITIRVNREYNYGNLTKNGLTSVINQVFKTEHESETALDYITDWDYEIENNSTIEDLIEKVREILIKEQII